jgi:plastocyanin
MRRRGIGVLVVGSLVSLGIACSDDDQGPSEPPLTIEKAATKSGDEQTGPAGTALGNPLRVFITRDGQPAEGVSVNWAAGQGGSISQAQESDELGIATAVWTLGPAPGNQVATAEVSDAAGSPLTYTATAEPNEPPPSATVRVLSSNTFDPAIIRVAPGSAVTWQWEEGSGLHNVVPDADEPAPSGVLTAGPHTYTHTFETPGTYLYYCVAHGNRNGIGMAGTVVVQAN